MREDLLVRLQQALPALRPSESRVARFVLEDATRASTLTISEMATAAGTSTTSVVRLCRRIGFDGYRDFRPALAIAAAGEDGRRVEFGVSNGDIDVSDEPSTVWRKLAFEEARTVQETVERLDLKTVERVVAAIDAASVVDVYGSASSGLAAQDLQQKLHRIGYQVNAWVDPHLALMSAAALPEHAVAVGFSHSGETEEAISALSTARGGGAFAVAVTNFPGSPLAQAADAVITTVSKETRFRYAAMSSRMAQLIIVDVLFMGVAGLHPEATRASLAKTFAAVEDRRRSSRQR
ncbi:MAG: MurR/RpiR family transcriptional regulator [Pseudoclavibacter sp.]|jgi:DNA-binding MurR/RpiR family transcriptional regulator